MPEAETQSHLSSSSILSRRLELFGHALLVAYAAAVLSGSLPVNLLSPAWEVQFCTVLVHNGGLALVGLGLVHLAAYLEPDNVALQARRAALARWAIPAAFGFLLVVPLQGVAAWRTVHEAGLRQASQLQASRQRLEEMRRAIRTAPDLPTLQSSLQRVGVPPLVGVDTSAPLPLLKGRLLEGMNQAEDQLTGRLGHQNPSGILDLALRSAGIMVTALAYGLAFLAGSQRRHVRISPLQEWQRAQLQKRKLRLYRRKGPL